MKRDFTVRIVIGAVLALLLAGPVLPRWAMFLIDVSLCYGLVLLGMMLLIRTGLVSFGHVPTGKFAGLIGRNGVSKTTLVRSTMGILPACQGTISFDGRPREGLSRSLGS